MAAAPKKNPLLKLAEPWPDADALNVRFSYDDGVTEEAGSMDAFYNEFRRSAYQESDIDTVRIIRELAAEGRFDTEHF